MLLLLFTEKFVYSAHENIIYWILGSEISIFTGILAYIVFSQMYGFQWNRNASEGRSSSSFCKKSQDVIKLQCTA